MISGLFAVLFSSMIRSVRELRSKQKSLPTPSNSRPTAPESETAPKDLACRSPSLGVALAFLARVEISAKHRETRDRDRMAPQRLSLLVWEESPAPRSPTRL